MTGLNFNAGQNALREKRVLRQMEPNTKQATIFHTPDYENKIKTIPFFRIGSLENAKDGQTFRIEKHKLPIRF